MSEVQDRFRHRRVACLLELTQADCDSLVNGVTSNRSVRGR